jgi:predicted RND superfamily exporter protein
LIVLLAALLFTTPYLIYTYNLTGKIFYWGTPGGDSLYWMSTPWENEYGNWYGDFNLLPRSEKEIQSNIPGYLDSLKLHHQEDYNKIFSYHDVINREQMFKQIAIENIKAHPLKYLENCISNTGRLLFSFPYSYNIQNNRTLLRLPLNGALVLLSIICLILTFFNWKRLFFPIKIILFFLFLYLGASILVSATVRMFTIIVPLLLFWIGYIFQQTIKVNLYFKDKI